MFMIRSHRSAHAINRPIIISTATEKKIVRDDWKHSILCLSLLLYLQIISIDSRIFDSTPYQIIYLYPQISNNILSKIFYYWSVNKNYKTKELNSISSSISFFTSFSHDKVKPHFHDHDILCQSIFKGNVLSY